MIYSDNAIKILAALQYKGIGTAWIINNWSTNITDEQVVLLLNKTGKSIVTSREEFISIKNKIENKICSYSEIDGVVGYGDFNFPHCRGCVKPSEYPVILFYRGNIALLQQSNNNVAVIGVLKPEQNIIEREKRMVDQLVKHNYTILSGLALGCDSVAHQQALRSSGQTIAVLPSPIMNIIPTQNKELAEQIVKNGGLLITEYHEEVNSFAQLRGRYDKRDRLQAMFSDAIVLTASYDINENGNDCGSRLAMDYARKYQIPRYVMYNENTDATNPQFDLNRRILKEGNSQIITMQKIANLISPCQGQTHIHRKSTIQLDLFE